MTDTVKNCFYCKEEIPAKALRCKWCGEQAGLFFLFYKGLSQLLGVFILGIIGFVVWFIILH